MPTSQTKQGQTTQNDRYSNQDKQAGQSNSPSKSGSDRSDSENRSGNQMDRDPNRFGASNKG